MSSEMKYYMYNGETTAYGSNSYLTLAQMTINAQCIYDYLLNKGWSKNAICGMLGNMQTESTINPGIWQNLKANNMKGGFGLVQWTPASKYINWANERGLDYLDIINQLNKILDEVENGGQWIKTSAHPLSFKDFVCSKKSPEDLAAAFVFNYERPASDETVPTRREQARYWFDTLPVKA